MLRLNWPFLLCDYSYNFTKPRILYSQRTMERTTAILVIYLCLFEIIVACDNDHCPDDLFSCKNGQCISNLLVCDGEDQCGNGIDEIDCKGRSKIESHKCPAEHYKCSQSVTCIPKRWICDGHKDCPNDDDEAHCDNVPCDGFLCPNKECIPKRWRCDQTKDCADGSDELGCLVKPVFDCTLQNGKFQCITGECINLTKFCDNHTDCLEGDDEGPFCQVDPCSSYGCSDKCVNTPNGPRCLCPHGFQIDTSQGGDDKKCEDINECAENPAHFCSHQCTNTYGSYHCSCLPGYALAPNNRTCNATGSDPILYFTDSISIRAYNPRRKLYWQVRKASLKAMGIDAFVSGKRLFWAEYDARRAGVFSSTTKGEDLTAVIAMGLRRPEDVAFDWVAHNIYITDSELRSIIACKYEEVICKVLIKQGEGFLLRGIIVAPKEGLMYWTNWGNQPGIYAASMDGSHERALVTKDIQWPECLTLDETTFRLYWTDGKKKTVEYYHTLIGSRNILIPGGTYHPFAVAVFEDNLYWSDSAINVINVDNKFTGHNHSVLTARSHFTSFGMVVFHELRQPVIRNRCFGSQCSHLCLLRPGGYSCACPQHLMLKRDGKTCMPKRNDSYFMIIMDGTVKKLYPEAIGKDVIMELDVPPMINISTFTYNKDNDTFYVVSSNAQQLYALRKTKPKIRLIANYTQSVIRRIIYDSHSTNLYLLDSKNGAVKVIREVNNDSGYEEAIVLQDLESARDFVLDQKHGLMFVALGEPDPHILVSAMDGTNPRRLFIKHLGVPSALYLDQHSNRLFFADSKKGTIETVFLGKTFEEHEFTTSVIHKNLGEVTSLAVWDDLLYWTKKEGRKLMHSHINQPYMVSTLIPNEQHHPTSAVDRIVSMV